MSVSSIRNERRIIPRWRSFSTAVRAGELRSHRPKAGISIETQDEYLSLCAKWKAEKNLISAIELLNYCFTTEITDYCLEAANFIKDNDNSSPDMISVAKSVLLYETDHANNKNHDIAQFSFDSITAHVYQQIASLKKQLSLWPNNAIQWIDLARLYAILGQFSKADNAIKIALQLGGTNRHIIRSASRYAIHVNNPELAQSILHKVNNFYSDPWLLASEIAVSCILNKETRFAKKGLNYIHRNEFTPWNLTELAGSLGTMEMKHGAIKSAKKLFAQSLVDPNDNALAQAEWAIEKIGKISIPESKFKIAHPYEAFVRQSFRNGNWKKALEWTIKWTCDEPYSSAPALAGSFIANALNEDPKCGLQFCDIGLRSNPDDERLLNNKVVALAHLGRLNDALAIFSKINIGRSDDKQTSVLTATAGLLAFRSGNIETGREWYLRSIQLAHRHGYYYLEAMAAIYHAYEEVRANTSEAKTAVDKAKNITKKKLPKEILAIKEKFDSYISKSNL